MNIIILSIILLNETKDVKNDTTKSSAIARNKRVYIDEHNKKVLDIM